MKWAIGVQSGEKFVQIFRSVGGISRLSRLEKDEQQRSGGAATAWSGAVHDEPDFLDNVRIFVVHESEHAESRQPDAHQSPCSRQMSNQSGHARHSRFWNGLQLQTGRWQHVSWSDAAVQSLDRQLGNKFSNLICLATMHNLDWQLGNDFSCCLSRDDSKYPFYSTKIIK